MAKSTTDKAKTTKADTKKTADKKPAAAKKTTSAKEAAPKAPAAKKDAPKKAATSKPKANAGETLAQKSREVIDAFSKMEGAKYHEVKEKLEWCLGSYQHDKNPQGLKEYGHQAVDMLKTAKKEKAGEVSQKLITDMEKAIAKV